MIGVRLAKMPDGTFTLILYAAPGVPKARLGPMDRATATAKMRAMYRDLGIGAETAAYHGIDVRAAS